MAGARKPCPQLLRNRRIFGNFDASSENSRTFAVGKDKGFGCYRKIIKLAPPYYTRAMMPLEPRRKMCSDHQHGNNATMQVKWLVASSLAVCMNLVLLLSVQLARA